MTLNKAKIKDILKYNFIKIPSRIGYLDIFICIYIVF